MATVSNLLIDGMLKKGATRVLITKLEWADTSKDVLIKSLNLLQTMVKLQPESLKMMNNQSIVPAIFTCL